MSTDEDNDKPSRRIKFLKNTSMFKADGNLDWKQLIGKTVVAMCAFLLVYSIVLIFVRDEYAVIGEWVSTHLGFVGIGMFAFLVDMFIVPMSVDLIFPFTMSMAPVTLILVLGICSALGGYCGYWIGRLLGKLSFVRKITSSFSSDGEKMFKRYGLWAIVIAGLTPIPFSTVCWLAGMLRTPAGWTFLACLSRIPRMALYYMFFAGGLMVIF